MPRKQHGMITEVVLAVGAKMAYEFESMFNLDFDGDRATLLILPDVRYTVPTWQNQSANKSSRVCELDADSTHDFEIRIAGWTDGVDVVRVEEGTAVPVAIDGPGTRFRVHAGRYELTRHPTK